MGGRTPMPGPCRKISETFLHFAARILQDLPTEAPERHARLSGAPTPSPHSVAW
jgi:hypothetical protein